MKKLRWLLFVAVALALAIPPLLINGIYSYAAYNHMGDIDSVNFRTVYPEQVGSKLDSCTLCHGGGSYVSGGKTTTLGSCQWCHYKTEYGANEIPANLLTTLNQYGKDYLSAGRSSAALLAIARDDSDGDGYNNDAEITAGSYPGDSKDTPVTIPAPSRVFSLKELEAMPQHTQFLEMNASKSDDSYTKYSGVALETLIDAIKLPGATGITVFSPDGFATYHPFSSSTNPNSYHVYGPYPQGTFYYNESADIAINPPDPPNYPTGGWCDYGSPSAAGLENGTVIDNAEGLKLLLALKRDGQYLAPGVLNSQNKLDGEGPFRVVPPQKTPGPPDQRSSSTNQAVIWPYKSTMDHNAGFSSRTVTMIRVEPLPAGTTDINTMEAGWPYVEERKIIIYGAINPLPNENLNSSLTSLIDEIKSEKDTAFKNKSSKVALVNKIEAISKQIAEGAYSEAISKLNEDILKKMDGYLTGKVDDNDWITDIEVQKQLSSRIQKIWIMLLLVK